MSIDERIERLTERHKALAHSVGMLRDSVHETSSNVNALTARFDSLTTKPSKTMSAEFPEPKASPEISVWLSLE